MPTCCTLHHRWSGQLRCLCMEKCVISCQILLALSWLSLKEHSVPSYLNFASSVAYLTRVEAACTFMTKSLLTDKSAWSVLLNSDHWLFSNPSEISLPSGLKLCTLSIFQTIVTYVSLHKKIWLPTVIISDIKSMLTGNYFPQTAFCHYCRPKQKEKKEKHWHSNKTP